MFKELKNRVRQRIVSEHNQLFSKEDIAESELRALILRVINTMNAREGLALTQADKDLIINELLDEFMGFGPIECYMRDPQVSEIMINGPKRVYIEKQGRKELTEVTFEDESHLMYLVYKLLAPTRRRVDELFPFTEISLPDGSRANIVIAPIAKNGPVVTLRKFLKNINTVEDLIKLGTLDKRMGDFLIASIRGCANIIFSGASSSGKTTTLNVLSYYLSEDERIVTIEDTAELHLSQDHVVRLEARQANIEGKGEITIRELFKNSLRMRPDRIILGEIRGAEALEMLQAICSGHKGSLVVLHADSPQDVVYRLETMVLTSGVPLKLETIHRHIAAAIDLIVQQEQFPDGARRITNITQVNGLKDGQVVLEDIFVYDIEGLDSRGDIQGRWRATGVIPKFYPLLKKIGIELPQETFHKG